MLLDTSGLLCLLHKSERYHAEAIQHYQAAPGKITHNYVIAEFIALAMVRGLSRKIALDFVIGLETSPHVTRHWVDPILHNQAIHLLRERTDKSYSLCDAVSFVLMQRENTHNALTTDHHFEQEGFYKLLG